MNDPNKKANPEETPKAEKIELTDDEVEKAAGGAKFNSWGDEKKSRRPK